MCSSEQQRLMRRFAGSCRFVFNKALALQKERFDQGQSILTYAALCRMLTEWKRQPEYSWLSEAPVQALQQSLKDLDRAYTNYFEKRANLPRFKKKGQHDSFRHPRFCKLDQANSRISLPKQGWVRYRNSRPVVGVVKSVTVSQSCGKWFVSIQTQREVAQPVGQGSPVGVDLGIRRFATLSDGAFFTPLNSFKRHEKALAKAQRRMKHKNKFSNSWKRAKAHVQKIHWRIANVRRDYLHKTTTTISQDHAIVCIEDLRVRNMSKSAAGETGNPGRNVRAKSALNKAILDQGWFEFRRQLDYKLAWKGGCLIAVPPQNTSLTCPACGHLAKENRQTQARFACVECRFEEDADLVGAINVLRRGEMQLGSEGPDLARLACEVNGVVIPSAAGTHRSDLATG